MWPFIEPIQLIRYLIVCRVNRTLVRLSTTPGAEFSHVLGAIIAERLPTTEAAAWQKAIPDQDRELSTSMNPASAAWPIESVLFVYPVKAHYGQDELIVWELELLGACADHGFFLQIILPAIEQASTTTDPRWHKPNRLWGRFDIQAIYAAAGPRWEPVVRQGQLDLRRRVTATQWSEGLEWAADVDRTYDRLTWATPFDLRPAGNKRRPAVPMLVDLLEALIERMRVFIPGKYTTTQNVLNALPEAERAALQQAIDGVRDIPLRSHDLEQAYRRWPEFMHGRQTFAMIPHPTVRYLELASILHIGRQTHIGFGAFQIQ